MTNILDKSAVLCENRHEGTSVEFWNNQLIIADADGNCVSATIDRNGLLELAKRIKATVKDSEKAERSGAKMGSKLTEELITLKGDSAESFAALRKSLSKLVGYEGAYRDEYIDGFCMALLPVATIAAVNFPSGKCEDTEELVF